MASKTARPPAAPDLSIIYRRLDAIKHLPRNAKDHDVGAIVAAIREFGMIDPLAINEKTGHDFDGNGRLKALRAMMAENSSAPPKNVRIARDGMWMIPTVAGINLSPVEEARAGLALNRVHDLGGYDQGTLAEILSDLASEQALGATGYDANDVDALLRAMNDARNAFDQADVVHIKLAERFLIPPFSILDARQGYWQARKDAWLALGIQSEVGRGENLLQFIDTVRLPARGDASPLTYTGRPAEYQAGYRENGKGERQHTLGANPPNSAAALSHAMRDAGMGTGKGAPNALRKGDGPASIETASLGNGALTVHTTIHPFPFRV